MGRARDPDREGRVVLVSGPSIPTIRNLIHAGGRWSPVPVSEEIMQPVQFGAFAAVGPSPITFEGPFTVPDLIERGVPVEEACMIVWPVTPEAFEEYVRSRSAC